MTALPAPDPHKAAELLAAHNATRMSAAAPARAAQALRAAIDMGLRARPAVCDHHGPYSERGITTTGGAVRWTGCPQCAAEVQAVRERVAADEARAAARRVADAQAQAALRMANVPDTLRDRTFASYTARCREQRFALAVASDYAERFDEYAAAGRGLVFIGRTGTGKGHLAAAILNTLAPRMRVQYMTVRDMLRTVRDTWRPGSARSESDVLADLTRGIRLLVLDELGVQRATADEAHTLFDVLDGRYMAGRPTILMGNLSAGEVDDILGERLSSRVRERCAWVPFEWADYRTGGR